MLTLTFVRGHLNLVPALNTKTHFFEDTINLFIKNHSPVFSRKHQVVQQNRYVLAFVYVIAHTAKLPKTKQRRKRRGIYPKGLNLSKTSTFPKNMYGGRLKRGECSTTLV